MLRLLWSDIKIFYGVNLWKGKQHGCGFVGCVTALARAKSGLWFKACVTELHHSLVVDVYLHGALWAESTKTTTIRRRLPLFSIRCLMYCLLCWIQTILFRDNSDWLVHDFIHLKFMFHQAKSGKPHSHNKVIIDCVWGMVAELRGDGSDMSRSTSSTSGGVPIIFCALGFFAWELGD